MLSDTTTSTAKQWLADNVCGCDEPRWGHGTWDSELSLQEKLALQPPSCLVCLNIHDNCLFVCTRCKFSYVNWFAHPANGAYREGFYCYFCLEIAFPRNPIWTFSGTRSYLADPKRLKIPPRDTLIVPGHAEAVKPRTYDSETQKRLDAFRESLKGI